MHSVNPSAPSAAVGRADARLLLGDGTAVWLRHAEIAARPGQHEEIAALDPHARRVGVTTYERVYGPRALVTLAVDDEYWHRGLPEALLTRLCASAATFGISTFIVRVQASDVRLLGLLRQAFAARWRREGSFVDAEFATSVPS
jgi:GNAT superfamily N-acetyltransferase